MPLLIKTRLGLAAKLAICVIASTAAFFALFGYINLRMERSASEDLIKQSAYRVADIILRSTHEEMLHFIDTFLRTDFTHDERHVRRISQLASFETTGVLPPLPESAIGLGPDA